MVESLKLYSSFHRVEASLGANLESSLYCGGQTVK